MKPFSERIGAVEAPVLLQLEGISEPLRNSIWNLIVTVYAEAETGWWKLTDAIAEFFLKIPKDDLPQYEEQRRIWLKKKYYGLSWYQAYDLAEFISANHRTMYKHSVWDEKKLHLVLNGIFQEERSGYRFVGGELAPITSSAEISTVEDALNATSRTGLSGAHKHIETALQHFGARPIPDYRNSIKEAISAIESVAVKISGASSQGLAGALDQLGKAIEIHGALRSSFVKLYGYTSDAGALGMRFLMIRVLVLMKRNTCLYRVLHL